jgi:hypothetical protein
MSSSAHLDSEKVSNFDLLFNILFYFNCLNILLKDLLLKEFKLTCDYKDDQREISLSKNDIVEILDITKSEKWLVKTKYNNITEVCYIPPNLLEPCENIGFDDCLLDVERQNNLCKKKYSSCSKLEQSNVSSKNAFNN